MEMYKVTYLMCSEEIAEVAPAEVLLRAKASRSMAAKPVSSALQHRASCHTTVTVQHTTLSPFRGKMHVSPSNLKTHFRKE